MKTLRNELEACSPEVWTLLEDLAVELRALLWEDANDMTRGAMVGEPVECIAFAKWWIQRAKGLPTDVPGNYPIFRENTNTPMTDTPETDALDRDYAADEAVWEHMRTLERERDALMKDYEFVVDTLSQLIKKHDLDV